MPHTPQEGGRAREASSSRGKMIRNLNGEEVMMSTGQSLGIFVSGQGYVETIQRPVQNWRAPS